MTGKETCRDQPIRHMIGVQVTRYKATTTVINGVMPTLDARRFQKKNEGVDLLV